MKKILMMVLPVLAFLGGAFGGDLLHGSAPPADAAAKGDGGATPPAKAEAGEVAATPAPAAEATPAPAEKEGETDAASAEDWFHFPDQFFVPILRNGSTSAVMVLSLTIEMPAASRAKIEAQEHRLRDALLNALMIQANTGGFDGNFTSTASMDALRSALLAAARKAGGPEISGVLIEDLARQDQ
ncbi:hypothetical protein GL279_06455 [Paracoccus limosus]|uniref:Flagellar protein FliL n=1 Tax=Paracoccus limosus TaxID=913252 RepID=A0A844H086_9RHOB|nr:hypothetical protein [Paracoccus limosus]MTH34242.1 hypothetical protein [Paracoccus limosus]